MTGESLETLLDKLCQGDEAAAERVFREYEPFLRLVVRRMLPARLRSKFDSVDVVQSVWGDLLDGFREAGWRFKDPAHLRAFLVKATRHRFLDRLRQHQPAMNRERSLELERLEERAPSSDPRPSEIVQADELWEEMMALCPPAHHELLRLKRQGRTNAEIAERTGLHPSSVRRILYDLARQLALKKASQARQEDGKEAT
jgi:RNA polymerase sigma factor (sigma-70 family)